MANYTFTAKDGHCPGCNAFGRRWYIQDKYIGGDKYEYALMSRSLAIEEPLVFLNKGHLAKWLNGDGSDRNYEDDIADFIISRHIYFDSSDKALLSKDGINYIYDKAKITLTKSVDSVQETGWCSTYLECLNMAKDILKSKELQS